MAPLPVDKFCESGDTEDLRLWIAWTMTDPDCVLDEYGIDISVEDLFLMVED